jgi:hypothetical protein
MLRIAHCLDNRIIDGGKVVSPMHQPHFTPQKHYFNASGTHFVFSRHTANIPDFGIFITEGCKNATINFIMSVYPPLSLSARKINREPLKYDIGEHYLNLSTHSNLAEI